ncbi:winged helix-turn-helix transcriptional regulator [Nocardiopsis changdeensis]|uniref:Helix-turn-helix transcriptional regulator n=1 Tax=Nocardiopsis changdeensis TaxID=2831969 RepID=A0ABX8BJ09_9ACTN|nr:MULTISPECIES: helix-turn-helix domain-containing protein [Nocardiopsis]QUX21037.1 helix-turn-helix transcriptional regulator [Nocardiopsis changdeensis]QYX36967.1 helix-turn-helix transcriptional regulator [Nocardiopsis sp. MT53]
MTDPEWTDPHCPVARTLDLLGDRWSLLIVRDAFDGVRRFNDFRRGLGIARNILSDRLRALIAVGVMEQRPNERGTRNEYVLTDKGRDLFTVVVALRQWGERHAFEPGEERSELLVLATGAPVPPVAPAAADGTPLDAADTRVRKVGDPGE